MGALLSGGLRLTSQRSVIKSDQSNAGCVFVVLARRL